MLKKLILVVLVFGTILAAAIFVLDRTSQETEQTSIAVNSFDECFAAGYPVMESYPEQCVTPDGRSFTREITNEDEYSNEIRVDNPVPNQLVSSPLQVMGQARGSWFFEASLSVAIYDDVGNPLGQGVALAEGDWMTENFVPFTADLDFDNTTAVEGEIRIQNANPSGLIENEKELIIPVRFR